MSIAPRNKYKLVFVGDMSVGKTSIISMFMYNHFDQSYDATIGIDFLAKTHTVDGKTIRLQLWDTAGQERFRSLIPSYIRDSSVAVVVYAVNHKDSFDSCEHWIKEVRKERGEDVLIVLVGNKSDQRAEVSTSEGQALAHHHKAMFLETSAKNGDNIQKLFNDICKELPEKGSAGGGRKAGGVKVSAPGPQSGGGCC